MFCFEHDEIEGVGGGFIGEKYIGYEFYRQDGFQKTYYVDLGPPM